MSQVLSLQAASHFRASLNTVREVEHRYVTLSRPQLSRCRRFCFPARASMHSSPLVWPSNNTRTNKCLFQPYIPSAFGTRNNWSPTRGRFCPPMEVAVEPSCFLTIHIHLFWAI